MNRSHAKQACRRAMIATSIASLLVGHMTAQCLSAQQPGEGQVKVPGAEIEPGTRVRITIASSSKPVVGRIDALEAQHVHLVDEKDHSLLAIPRGTIRRIERSRVRRSFGQRASPGMAAGGLLGLIVGVVTTENADDVDCDSRHPFCLDLDLPPNKVMAGMGGLGIGMIVGGLISWALVPGESWEDAHLPALTIAADSRGARLALAIPLGSRGR